MKLLEFFEEDNGHLSSVRLFNFLIIATFVMDWQKDIWSNTPFNPTWEQIAIVAGVLGLKVWQKMTEEKGVETKP